MYHDDLVSYGIIYQMTFERFDEGYEVYQN